MKTRTLIGLLAVWLGVGVARGTLYDENFNGLNTAIPVGNPVGVSISLGITAVPESVALALLVFLGLLVLHWCLGKCWGAEAGRCGEVGGQI